MNRLRVSVNVPILLVTIFLGFTIYCRYKIESKIGFVMLPVEMIIIFVLAIRSNNFSDSKGFTSHLFVINLLFMAYRILASFLTTGDFSNGAKKITYYELGTFLLLFLALKCTSEKTVIRTFVIVGVFNSLIGIYETITKSSVFMRFIEVNSRKLITSSMGSSLARTRTIFMHPTICGVFCMTALCVSLYYPFNNKGLDVLAKLSMLICLLGTKTRGAWIAFAAIVIVFVIQERLLSNRSISLNSIATTLGIIAFGLCFLFLFYGQIVGFVRDIIDRWFVGFQSSNAANYNRLKMLSIGLEDYSHWSIKSKLLGKGKGYALSLLARHAIRGWKTAVDNTYLTMLLDYGIVGLGFMLFFLGVSLVNIFKKGSYISKMCGSAILGIFVAGFFYDMYWWFTTNFLISFFLCSIIIYERDESCKKNSDKV